jgi:hypothetical protein
VSVAAGPVGLGGTVATSAMISSGVGAVREVRASIDANAGRTATEIELKLSELNARRWRNLAKRYRRIRGSRRRAPALASRRACQLAREVRVLPTSPRASRKSRSRSNLCSCRRSVRCRDERLEDVGEVRDRHLDCASLSVGIGYLVAAWRGAKRAAVEHWRYPPLRRC